MRSAILLVLSLAACGKAPSGYREFVHQTNTVTCDAVLRCCMAETTVEACASSADAVDEHNTTQIEDAIRSGAFTFHADVASLCVDAMRGALTSCDASSTNLGANGKLCAGVLTTGDAGSSLMSRSDLAEGATCDSGIECSSGVCLGGNCQPPLTIRLAVCGSG